MKIAYIFPGQGTQVVGMGKDIYDKYDEARNVYTKIDNAINENVEDITYNTDQEVLNQTKNTQIAIYAMSMSILEILNNRNIKPQAAAGLSLGEYSALTCAKSLPIEDGARIVRVRGKLMQELAPAGDWSMAAIIGLEDDKVEEACSKVEKGFVRAVNYNCPGQVVVSGEKDAVLRAMEIAKEEGAKKVVELKTSGPFHTSKLIKASEALSKELEKIQINKFNTKVIKNIDGEIYTDNDNIKEILEKHIISPVKFSKTIQTMLNEDVDTFIEIGPGKSLAGFVKRTKTEKPITIININNVETLENAINYFKNI